MLIMRLWFLNLLLALLCLTKPVSAQTDTIYTRQGDMLVGSIKLLSGTSLFFSTTYTNEAISLKWTEITALKTTKQFKVMDKKGVLYIGRLSMDTAHAEQVLLKTADTTLTIKKNDIGQLSRYDPKNIKDKLTLKFDMGFITAKANNVRQLSFGTKLGYEAKKWQFGFDYFTFGSLVDTIISSRGSLGLGASYVLPKNWFLSGRLHWFSSTEQQLDMRAIQSMGIGKYVIRQNNQELRLFTGGSFNREKFTESEEQFSSAELFLSAHHLFKPVKGFDLLTDFVLSPSLSDEGRIRTYFNTEAKITVIRHFTFGLSYTLNHDSKPPVASSKTDFIFNFKLGWTLQ